MDSQYQYYAFISYKREDEKWAKWLQKKLEHYKLPTSIRKVNPNLPDKVRPIFKDTTDLSGGVLEKVIKDALSSSKYLIVICSPRAAQSPWVCKEVQEFIDSGREDYIIPFIVDGEPNSIDIATECFPKNLRDLKGDRELLGININEMGRDAAAIKVVANMLCVRFDELWQREKRGQKRRRKIFIILSFFFLSLSTGVTLYILNQNIKIEETILKMRENKARWVAEMAIKLVDENDSYLAQLLLLEVVPQNQSNGFPYVPEVENALYYSLYKNTKKLSQSNYQFKSIGWSMDDNYIIGETIDNDICVWDAQSGALLSGGDLSVIYNGDDINKNTIQPLYASELEMYDIYQHQPSRNIYNYQNIIFDSNKDDEYIKILDDGYPYIFNHNNNCKEKIPIKSPIFVFFSKNPLNESGDIVLINEESIIFWSRDGKQIKNKIDFDDYYDSYYGSICSVYSNKDESFIVLEYVKHYQSQWVLFDISNYKRNVVWSYSPFVFNSKGTSYLYNASIRYDLYEYAIVTEESESPFNIMSFCADTTLTIQYAFLDNSHIINEKGEYIIDTTICYIDSSIHIYYNQNKYGKILGYSNSKSYFVSLSENNELELYSINGKLISSIPITEPRDQYLRVNISNAGDAVLVEQGHPYDNGYEIEMEYVYYIWNVNKMSYQQIYTSNYPNSVDLTSDGKYIYTSNQEIIHVHSNTISYLEQINMETNDFSLQVTLSSDDAYCVIWASKDIAVWDTKNNKLIWQKKLGGQYGAKLAYINDVQICPDNKKIFATWRWGVEIYLLNSGHNIGSIEHYGECLTTIFSADNKTVSLIAIPEILQFRNPSLQDIISSVKSNLHNRKLTEAERERFYFE